MQHIEPTSDGQPPVTSNDDGLDSRLIEILPAMIEEAQAKPPMQWDGRGMTVFSRSGEVVLDMYGFAPHSPDETRRIQRENQRIANANILRSVIRKPFLDLTPLAALTGLETLHLDSTPLADARDCPDSILAEGGAA